MVKFNVGDLFIDISARKEGEVVTADRITYKYLGPYSERNNKTYSHIYTVYEPHMIVTTNNDNKIISIEVIPSQDGGARRKTNRRRRSTRRRTTRRHK